MFICYREKMQSLYGEKCESLFIFACFAILSFFSKSPHNNSRGIYPDRVSHIIDKPEG